jgi:CubicO group peptidase (beta-lactamase class C family)
MPRRRVVIAVVMAAAALTSMLLASGAQAIAEPGCSGPAGIAFYAGPRLPLKANGDGFYESNPTYTVPAADEGSWRRSTPGAQSMNAAGLQNGIDWLGRRYKNLLSVLVVRNGYLVKERYFHGGAANHANNIHSASKSIIQALIGVAIQKGYIGSITDRVSKYLPWYFTGLSRREQRITIAEMLDMQSGLTWAEDSSEFQVQTHPNWIRAILNQGMRSTPGTGTFNYSTGNFHVLSAMLAAATRMSTCQFAENNLFGSVGIYPAHWGVDPTTGVDMGGCDLYMTPRALALFAQLYLNDGVARGRRIVPTATVARPPRRPTTTAAGSITTSAGGRGLSAESTCTWRGGTTASSPT